jgi:hypothetical protein
MSSWRWLAVHLAHDIGKKPWLPLVWEFLLNFFANGAGRGGVGCRGVHSWLDSTNQSKPCQWNQVCCQPPTSTGQVSRWWSYPADSKEWDSPFSFHFAIVWTSVGLVLAFEHPSLILTGIRYVPFNIFIPAQSWYWVENCFLAQHWFWFSGSESQTLFQASSR